MLLFATKVLSVHERSCETFIFPKVIISLAINQSNIGLKIKMYSVVIERR